MTTEPRKPVTMAGDRLAGWLDFASRRLDGVPLVSSVLAIEAEATARALEAAKERVRALPVKGDSRRIDRPGGDYTIVMGGCDDYRALVLAALDEPVEAEQ